MNRFTRGRSWLFAAALLVSAARSAAAQLAIPGAGEDRFGLLLAGQTISVTTGDARLAFNWTNDPHLTADDSCRQFQRGTPQYRDCLFRSVDTSQTFIDLTAGISGQKGERSLFANGTITPGYDLGVAVTRRLESASAHHGGYTDVYAGVIATSRPLTFATITPSGSATVADASERTVGLTTGVNFFLRENFAVGIGGGVKRAWSTPGLQKAMNVCTSTASGTTAAGQIVQVSTCDDGYTGPLADQWIDSVRLDVLKNFTRTKMDPASGDIVAVATVGVIGSVNVNHRTGTAAVYNLAVGPTLHPKGVPHKVLLAAVFGFADVSDAANQGKTLRDKFGVQLYFGVPLTGF